MAGRAARRLGRAEPVLLLHALIVSLQVVVACAVLGIAARRAWVVCLDRAVDPGLLRSALLGRVGRGEIDAAVALIERLRPAWAAEVLLPLGGLEEDPQRALLTIEERRLGVEAEAVGGLRALRILASVASALGFIGAALSIGWVYTGEHGLLALQPGWVESVGLSRAVLSIGLGVAVSSFALGSWRLLQQRTRQAVASLRRLCQGVEDRALRGDAEGRGAD